MKTENKIKILLNNILQRLLFLKDQIIKINALNDEPNNIILANDKIRSEIEILKLKSEQTLIKVGLIGPYSRRVSEYLEKNNTVTLSGLLTFIAESKSSLCTKINCLNNEHDSKVIEVVDLDSMDSNNDNAFDQTNSLQFNNRELENETFKKIDDNCYKDDDHYLKINLGFRPGLYLSGAKYNKAFNDSKIIEESYQLVTVIVDYDKCHNNIKFLYDYMVYHDEIANSLESFQYLNPYEKEIEIFKKYISNCDYSAENPDYIKHLSNVNFDLLFSINKSKHQYKNYGGQDCHEIQNNKYHSQKKGYEYICTDAKFIELINEFTKIPYEDRYLAIDCEYNQSRSYFGILCLIQISCVLGNYIIDTLAISKKALYKFNIVTTDPTFLKILHGCTGDISWLQRHFEIYVVNIFDTYIAGKIIDINGRLSLLALVQKFLNVELDKEAQLSDWTIRPLSQEQLNYAINDTKYLYKLFCAMKKEIYTLTQRPKKILKDIYLSSANLGKARYTNIPKKYSDIVDGYFGRIKPFPPCVLNYYSLAVILVWRDLYSRYHDIAPNKILTHKKIELLSRSFNGPFPNIKSICKQKISEIIEDVKHIVNHKNDVYIDQPLFNQKKRQLKLGGPNKSKIVRIYIPDTASNEDINLFTKTSRTSKASQNELICSFKNKQKSTRKLNPLNVNSSIIKNGNSNKKVFFKSDALIQQ